MSNINTSNIIVYIKYLKEAKGWPLNVENWRGRSDEQIQEKLGELYQYKANQEERSALEMTFLKAQAAKKQEVPEKPKPHTKPKTEENRGSIVSVIIGIAVASIVTYLAVNYISYSRLGYVYALSDDIAIHKDHDGNSSMVSRMDLFGKNAVKAHSWAMVHLMQQDTVGQFYKVGMDYSFFDYLFRKGNACYVSAMYTTRDKDLYDLYCRVFMNLQDDYADMDNLKLSTRNTIVSVFKSNMTFKNSAIAMPCFDSVNRTLVVAHFRRSDTISLLLPLTNGNTYSLMTDTSSNQTVVTPVSFLDTVKNVNANVRGRFLYKYENKEPYMYLMACNGDKYIAAFPFINFYKIKGLGVVSNPYLDNLSASELKARGVKKAAVGDFDSAICYYRLSLKNDSTSSDVNNLLGYTLYKQGNDNAALGVLQKAIALNARNSWAHYNISLIYWRLNEKDKALNEVRSAILLDSKMKNRFKMDKQFDGFHSNNTFNDMIK